MTQTYWLYFCLKSDATFGRGDGVAGSVDTEVQHDELGCPYLPGRAVKGILVNECADILAAIPEQERAGWEAAAVRLFGQPGSRSADSALLSIGDACLPQDLRQALRWDLAQQLAPIQNDEAAVHQARNAFRLRTLGSLTAVRQQTAMDASGLPKEHSLRSARVILRQTPFYALLQMGGQPDPDDLALLSACVKAFRRAGTSRNRGLGLLEADLLGADLASIREQHFLRFKQEVLA